MSGDGFHLYALDHPESARTVSARVKKLRFERAEQIVDGFAKDWADYQRRLGVLDGLALALDICEDIEKEQRE